jgi:hypothetical protein
MRCDGMTAFKCHRIRSDCKCDDKPFGLVKCSELLHKPSDYQYYMKDPQT